MAHVARRSLVVTGAQQMKMPYGLHTAKEYRRPVVRMANAALLRCYNGMRQSQAPLPVYLPLSAFPLLYFPEYRVTLHHAQDKDCARVTCQDRFLLVRPLSPRVMGVCSETHGGPYLSEALILTLIAGDT